MRSVRLLSRRNRRRRRLAGERPTDPRLFAEWAQVLRPPADADPVLVDRVRAAIDRLRASERDVINGLFFEQVTKTELAERLGLSRHEVRKRMLSAMAKLKRSLDAVR